MAYVVSEYRKRVHDLFRNGRLKTYPKNQLIHYAGDNLSHIYLIRDGSVKVYTILDSGDTRTLLILASGDIFPIAFATTLDWENYSLKYFYQALTDTQLQVIESQDFKSAIESDTEKLNTYLAYTSASNQAIMGQLEVMKQKKAISRIMLLLPYLIRKLGAQIKPHVYQLKIKVSHQELADLSGVTRETTTTLIKKLEKQGTLEQKEGKLIIYTKKPRAKARRKSK